MFSCSLIFPCYNEEQSIASVLDRALKTKALLEESGELSFLEVIVVDDGSTDSSQKILNSYGNRIKIICLKKQQGYGAALKRGFSEAKGDWLGFCDLDSTCDPGDLKLLLKTVLKEDYHVVWGLRMHKKSAMPFVRALGNRIFSLVLWLLSVKYVADPCSGFRIFKKDVLKDALLKFPDNLSFSLAFTAYCLREKIPFKSVKISYRERVGESKLHSLKDGFVFLKTIFDVLIFKRY